jgi:hypothetical protein
MSGGESLTLCFRDGDGVNEWSGNTERIFTCSRVYFSQGAKRLKWVRGRALRNISSS